MVVEGRKGKVNRCQLCGKFRPWDNLDLDFTPDTAFTSEHIAYECKMGYGCRVLSAAQEELRKLFGTPAQFKRSALNWTHVTREEAWAEIREYNNKWDAARENGVGAWA
jgi:hypothetical protein